MCSSSVESHIDFGLSSSLRLRLRHEAPDVLFYRISRGVSACDAIDCPIEAARTVGVLEDASGRSDGGLQSDSPWAIVAEDLQPRQPPRSEERRVGKEWRCGGPPYQGERQSAADA